MFFVKNKHLPLRRFMAFAGLSLFLALQLVGASNAQNVTQSYGSDEILQRGMIVGLKDKDADKVSALNIDRIGDMLGIVVNQNDAPITISDDNERIFVSTTGRYDVLVSDQQGAISPNDYVTVSSLAGVGMKAKPEQSDVVGRASAGFDGVNGIINTTTLSDNNGQTRKVNIGRIQVEITIGRNPDAKLTTGAPAFLSRAGEAIAGKSVSVIRLYLSAFVFGLGLLTAGAVLYAGIRSSIIAIGRNPLGKRNILRSLLGVALSSVFIFIVSVIAVYLLLKV